MSPPCLQGSHERSTTRNSFADWERLYNHLHYLGHSVQRTTLKVGEAQGKLFEEQCKQINGAFTGSRSCGTPDAGRMRRDLALGGFGEQLRRLEPQIIDYMEALETTNSHLDRLLTTGPCRGKSLLIKAQVAPLNGRLESSAISAGVTLRRLQLVYGGRASSHGGGRARSLADFGWKKFVRASSSFIPPWTNCRGSRIRGSAPRSRSRAWLVRVDSRSIYHCVHLDEAGRLARVKVKSPSFSNWRVFPSPCTTAT